MDKVQSMGDVLAWLDALEQASQAHSTGVWPLSSVLDHCAQSIEMSMQGFPRPKPALFQATAGRAAFALFKLRGRMSHGLAAPIPGAPALAASADWRGPAQRMRKAITDFNAFDGPLQPHFAYGQLSKPDFALAHVLHIANHQDEIALG